MPAVPFSASTWQKVSDIPGIPLNGTYSGIVTGPLSAVYDKDSRVVQVFNKQAHHFQGFANTAQVSVDDGLSWVTVFNEAADVGLNKVVFAGWSLPNPIGVGRLHFQARWDWTKSFFVANGTILPCGIDLYVSENGTGWSLLRRLHSWPQVNDDAVPGSGGAALWNNFPTITQPILLPGTGPGGVDAYWMASAFNFDAGPSPGRQNFRTATLWRSTNGIDWQDVLDLTPSFGTGALFGYWIRSTTGRLFLRNGVGISFTDGAANLLTATWSPSNLGALPPIGNIVQFFGGTLATHRQGTLTGPGFGAVSCDDGASFTSAGVTGLTIPQNRDGFLSKLGPNEGLVVTSGFNDPTTETVSYYTANGGETWQYGGVWLASTVGESPCMLAIRSGGTPIVVTRDGRCYVSTDRARGVVGTRTVCPLANAGLATARILNLCGHAITVNPC